MAKLIRFVPARVVEEGVCNAVLELLESVRALRLGEGCRDGSGDEGRDRCFMDDCRGGDGGLVDDEWVGFVKRRDTDAVAVDVPDDGYFVPCLLLLCCCCFEYIW